MRFSVKLSGGTTEAIAIASIDLKSRPANAKRLRACTPHSSPVRARAVVRRQCVTRFSPSNTPSEVLVLPMSITRSMNRPIQSDDLILTFFSLAQAFTPGSAETASLILGSHLWGFADLPRHERARSQSLL